MISNDLERVALRRLRHEEPRVNGTATGHTDPQQCRKLRLAASTGHYDVEWEVEFTDGTFATWPNASMEELIIARDLKRT